YQAWTNITKGEDNLFATAEPRLFKAALDGGGGGGHYHHDHSPADDETPNGDDGLVGGFEASALLTSSGSSGRDRGRGAGVLPAPPVEGPGGGEARPGRRRGFERWKPELAAESPGSGEGGQGPATGSGRDGSMELRRRRWKG
ncbi:unnamed protein product, partial [Ectocarpus sp. 13 AM-2016]